MELKLKLTILSLFIQFFTGVALFCATYFAPLYALKEQKRREKDEISRNNKLRIFYTLMSTRNQRLSYNHTEALNMIDMEFNNVNNVINAWNEYLDHLNNNTTYDEQWEQWNKEGDKLFISMLYEMSTFLGYSHTKLDIKNKCYRPQAHRDRESNQQEIERYLADILSHKKAFPIVIREPETTDGKKT